MPRPVAILAFANNKDRPLENLSRECEEIGHALRTANLDLEIVPIPEATIKNVYDYFREYLDRICIFHYAGHSDGKVLDFEQEAANGQGLAQILGQMPNLKFAFLNGCSTKGMVETFHNAGVQTVIATAVPIGDNTATDFSIQFYKALANFFPLGRAFDFAKPYILIQSSAAYRFLPGNLRHIGVQQVELVNELFPWAMYYKNSDTNISTEKWELRPEQAVGLQDNIGYTPNKSLSTTIARLALDHPDWIKEDDKEEIEKRYNQIVVDQTSVDYAGLQTSVGETMPEPVAVGLTRLSSASKKGINKLEKGPLSLLEYQVDLYITLTKLGAFTFLSSFFNEVEEKGLNNIIITPGQKEYLFRIFREEEQPDTYLDYSYLIKNIVQIFITNNIGSFIDETASYAKRLREDDALNNSHIFIQGVRQRLQDKSNPLNNKNDILTKCAQMENELCSVFRSIYFIFKYKLVRVKGIQLIKYRKLEAVYEHDWTVLYANPMRNDYNDATYMDCYSVILMKNIKSTKPYLSLSPFVIEENTLLGEAGSEAVLYFLKNTVSNEYMFQMVSDSRIERKLDDKYGLCSAEEIIPNTELEAPAKRRVQQIKRQLSDFKTILNQLQPQA